jgi:hypothetical protein
MLLRQQIFHARLTMHSATTGVCLFAELDQLRSDLLSSSNLIIHASYRLILQQLTVGFVSWLFLHEDDIFLANIPLSRYHSWIMISHHQILLAFQLFEFKFPMWGVSSWPNQPAT